LTEGEGPQRAAGTPPHPVPLSHLAPLAIAIARDPGSGALQIGLSPEELGQMHMQVTTEGEVLRIAMTVERPDTLDLLRRHADQLLADLRQAGLGDATLSFRQGQPGEGQAGEGQTGQGQAGQGQAGQGRAGDGQSGGGRAGQGSMPAPPATAPPPPGTASGGLGHAPLDLRL
jgi:flagellar hook-length control protein FliK